MSTITTTLLSILFFFNVPSRFLHKRNNAHGDKAIAPVLATAVPIEQYPIQASQLHAVPAVIKSSGYRKKRNNAYGDEAVPPTADLTIPVPAPAEQAPAQVSQSYGDAVPTAVETSGYRKKRNNAYGDEAVPPTADLTIPVPGPAEQAPAQVSQSYGGVVPTAIETSGYRKKRNNGYGDEALPPTADLTIPVPAHVEQAPAKVDQSYGAAATVVPSGY